jgi:methionyl aminopeptidase
MLTKRQTDIENIKKNGTMMGVILEDLAKLVRPGISTYELDKIAEKMIRAVGARPAFKGYKTHVADRPFPATVCISINEEVVHGIPKKKRILQDGDIVTLDIGMEWPYKTKEKGVYTDTALTIPVGKISSKAEKLLDVTREALERGIAAAQPGNSVASIGKAVESYVKSQGSYGIVRDLVGHGVGYTVHEEPFIPNYYDATLESILLKPGMVIAIEPMIGLGTWRVETMDDGWTIKMSDNLLSAHFEHTVIITEDGNIVATRRPSEKK